MSDAILSSILKNFFKLLFCFVILSIFLYIMQPFIISILLGGILALALIPFVDYFIRRGFKREKGVLIFTFISGIIGLIPVVAFFIHGSRVVSKLLHESNFAQFTEKLTKSSYQFIDYLSTLYGFDNDRPREKFASLLIYGGNSLSANFNTFVTAPTILMMGAVTTISVYCFLRESDKIRLLFDRYFYFNSINGDKFIHMFKVCFREVFFANIITGVVQATIVSSGALIFGVGDFFLIFFVTFVFSFIPVIGAAPIAALLGIICFMDGSFGAGAAMMIISAFTGVSDNLLRPLMGSFGEVKVHPFI